MKIIPEIFKGGWLTARGAFLEEMVGPYEHYVVRFRRKHYSASVPVCDVLLRDNVLRIRARASGPMPLDRIDRFGVDVHLGDPGCFDKVQEAVDGMLVEWSHEDCS